MTVNTDSLVLEHLRAIHGRVDKIDEGQDRLEHRLSTVEHHLAALVSAAAFDRGDLDSLRRRVERIEHRLELTDCSSPAPKRPISSGSRRASALEGRQHHGAYLG